MNAVETLSDLRRPRPLRLDDGGAPARRRAARIDEVIAALARNAGLHDLHVGVLAVGGYGRGELSPRSDVDLLFVPQRRAAPTVALREVLYPLWDASFEVGHALRPPRDAIEHADRDLTAATALLHARAVAGDAAASHELLERRVVWLRRSAPRLVRRILEATGERHRQRDRAGWALAPDLKEDVGGLRDVHVLEWLERAADLRLLEPEVEKAAGVLLAVREALHAEGARKNDRLWIDLQPAIARRLDVDLDELMAKLHSAARVIEHVSTRGRATAALAVLGGPRRSGNVRRVRPGINVVDGVLVSAPEVGPLELLAAYAHSGRPPPPERVADLERTLAAGPGPWDARRLAAFLDLLRGPLAPAALELLDHVGGFAPLLPEWQGIRGRAQHDPYHRYTVDGHTFLTIAEVTRVRSQENAVASSVDDASGLAALYLGALLHDIGKGSGEDHSVAGEQMARAACARMGVPPEVADDVAFLVRRHLLLPDTATRRDIHDGAVVENVARLVGTIRRLDLLYLLAVADGRATGPRAWNEWKAMLVRDLYGKTRRALETGELPARSDLALRATQLEAVDPALAGLTATLLARLPPSYLDSVPVTDMTLELRLLAEAERKGTIGYRIDPNEDRSVVTAVVPNRPGALARTAGVLALGRVSVLHAQAYSAADLALQRLVVRAPDGFGWARFGRDLAAAHSGRLALEREVERKAADYAAPQPLELDIRFPDASPHSTVVEVRTRDALGLLYAIAAAMSDLGVDIHVAKIDTRADRIVDVFYVRGLDGRTLDDDQKDALRRAVTHRIGRVIG